MRARPTSPTNPTALATDPPGDPAGSARGLRWITVTLAFACGASVANLYYAQPLLSLISHAFHVGQGTAATVVTATQVGYAVGQVAARLVSEREHTIFNEPQDVFALVPEVENVVDVLDVDVLAELCLEAIAHLFHRKAEPGGRGTVSAHEDRDRTLRGADGRLLPCGVGLTQGQAGHRASHQR